MVGRPDRRPAHERLDRARRGDRGHDRRRERRLVVEVRQQPGDRPGEERLAGARRPEQQQRVTAGEGDLERAPRDRLPAHVDEVDRRLIGRGWRGSPPRPRRSPARSRAAAAVAADASRAAPAASSAASATSAAGSASMPGRQPGLPDGLGRDDDPRARPVAASARHIGRIPGTRRTSPPSPSSPISASAAGTGPQLLRAEQDPERDREVQRRARPCAAPPARG